MEIGFCAGHNVDTVALHSYNVLSWVSKPFWRQSMLVDKPIRVSNRPFAWCRTPVFGFHIPLEEPDMGTHFGGGEKKPSGNEAWPGAEQEPVPGGPAPEDGGREQALRPGFFLSRAAVFGGGLARVCSERH